MRIQRDVGNLVFLAGLFVAGCGYNLRMAALPKPEVVQNAPEQMPVIPDPNPAVTTVPEGYRVEVVMKDLVYPTSVEFDDKQNMYIAESGYSYGDPSAPARVLRVSPDGTIGIAANWLMGPVTDLLWYKGLLYISHRGKVSVLDSDGGIRDLITGLPSLGDHHNNQMTAGPDGKIYFGQGTVTNSGVVGLDNFLYLWLPLYPHICDKPARDVTLNGTKFVTINPFIMGGGKGTAVVRTGAFSPFGEVSRKTVPGVTKANGTILRMDPDGSNLEVYAWGFRNPFGVMWGTDGQLYASEHGFDERGSRPIANDTDDLYIIKEGVWYGWPDYAGGIPVTDKRFKPKDRPQPEFLMEEHPPVEKPFMTFQPHIAVMKIGFDKGGRFGNSKHLFMAFFGDATPITGQQQMEHPGHKIVRINLQNQHTETFFANAEGKRTDLQANLITGELPPSIAGLRRPLDVVFSPDGQAMYVVDFGVMEALSTRVPFPKPFPGTGVIWRIVPEGATVAIPPAGLSALPGRSVAERQTDNR
ncbi:putative glucose/sorbosone dehydrogenase [Candidatus Jettenia caeni]|uniref:Putative glucose/sorbosone dehydrogenase n=1 Tax=Candidatus Jettenia caeni TaxID=247490 RepID=I3IQ10_9BACT|nr:PQQ-dependent sugar dehydrogenase [Candidatus Jettenia sp. AMX1]MCQ3928011.1 glucose dehydrogenase [Candidatus Jettenia sp.]NUN22318.1 PQQ-dependent sugar dehydrogenase [Candidatus Jettenia caeni]KAA0247226.1 MAG: glucose dehydrogenase [Candidatus Jettenia sp. AMX1]MCE7881455.1 glucose dehydrogenase [Candidatus Jettenia sp. AMX1]MDL1940508.1 glucose dehydrogenase [Candidatus Jettenia sp. AMX1]